MSLASHPEARLWEEVIEYTFSTEPEWLSEAVEFTGKGFEFNFEKLGVICGKGKLPDRICITLRSSPQKNNLAALPDTDAYNTINGNSHKPTHDESTTKTKDNGEVTAEDKEEVSPTSASTDNGRFLAVPGSDSSRRRVRRSESVIAREIRLQKKKEDEVKLERERAMRHLRRRKLKREVKSASEADGADISTELNSPKHGTERNAALSKCVEDTTSNNSSQINNTLQTGAAPIQGSTRHLAQTSQIHSPLKNGLLDEKPGKTEKRPVDKKITRRQILREKIKFAGVQFSDVDKSLANSDMAKNPTNQAEIEAKVTSEPSDREVIAASNTENNGEVVQVNRPYADRPYADRPYADRSMERIEQEIKALRLRERESRRIGVKI